MDRSMLEEIMLAVWLCEAIHASEDGSHLASVCNSQSTLLMCRQFTVSFAQADIVQNFKVEACQQDANITTGHLLRKYRKEQLYVYCITQTRKEAEWGGGEPEQKQGLGRKDKVLFGK